MGGEQHSPQQTIPGCLPGLYSQKPDSPDVRVCSGTTGGAQPGCPPRRLCLGTTAGSSPGLRGERLHPGQPRSGNAMGTPSDYRLTDRCESPVGAVGLRSTGFTPSTRRAIARSAAGSPFDRLPERSSPIMWPGRGRPAATSSSQSGHQGHHAPERRRGPGGPLRCGCRSPRHISCSPRCSRSSCTCSNCPSAPWSSRRSRRWHRPGPAAPTGPRSGRDRRPARSAPWAHPPRPARSR